MPALSHANLPVSCEALCPAQGQGSFPFSRAASGLPQVPLRPEPTGSASVQGVRGTSGSILSCTWVASCLSTAHGNECPLCVWLQPLLPLSPHPCPAVKSLLSLWVCDAGSFGRGRYPCLCWQGHSSASSSAATPILIVFQNRFSCVCSGWVRVRFRVAPPLF